MKSKKAISLIVLIITIIVMIILASAIIMSLDNANIFNKAEEAVDKTNAATNKYLSELKLAERELEKIQGPSKVTDTTPGQLRQEDTTYYIESIEDLVAFSNRVNGGETFDGLTVKLTKLLDFNSDNSYVNPERNDFGNVNEDDNTEETLKKELTTGKGFKPIGKRSNSGKSFPFKGTFDGDGAEIRNLYIKGTELEEAGLFGCAEDANFRNIGITGTIVNNDGISGALVTELINEEETTVIENCYSKVNQKANTLGGLGCDIYSSSPDKKIIIRDCYNTGSLSSEGGYSGYVGGLAAIIEYVEVDRCYNLGKITSNITNNFGSEVGGIIAYMTNSTIRNSYNSGDIYGNNTLVCGGIMGEGGNLIIENSYNAGKVISSSNDAMRVIAGLAGRFDGTIFNTFNIGEVNQEFALIDDMVDGTISKLYYVETDLEDIGSKPSSLEIPIEMSLEAMKSQTFVETLNRNIEGRDDLVKWKLGPNGYPVLDI